MSPRRSMRGACAAALAVLCLALAAAPASAEPGPITLVSTNGLEQANQAESPTLAIGGRYLAFAGQIGGLGGIFRKDLTDGAVVPVLARPEAEGSLDASAPSISADGRYVSFTTRERLDPAADQAPSSSDVYVADMATTPPTYTLVSALDGSGQGLTYEGGGGSVASPRAAISADGSRVVFVTTAASDLTGTAGAAEAPALQVAVREIAARRTILISAARDPLTGAMQATTPVAGGAAFSTPSLPPGAAISADGSTVAWIGIQIPSQAPVTEAEGTQIAAFAEKSQVYDEPLWRRVPSTADPAPETRRMIVPTQLEGMLSAANQKPYEEFCGSLTAAGWDLDPGLFQEPTPSLSADGDVVGVVGQPATFADAYLFDMSGATPVAQQLTRAIPPPLNEPCQVNSKYPATAGSIAGVTVSPGGDRVALTTFRQQFPIAPPTLVGAPPVSVGLPELYLADLPTGTLQRLTHGATESEPSLLLTTPESFQVSEGSNSVSFDATGETLAFASRASNLVPGDGNGTSSSPASDVFLVSDPREVPIPATSTIGPRPPSLRTTPRRVLAARATSRRDGTVRVAVSVPAAGLLQALASTDGGKDVKPRRIAAARRHPRLASTLAFSLRPARRFKARVGAAGGVEARLRLEFRGADGKPLRLLLDVRFHGHAKKGKGPRR